MFPLVFSLIKIHVKGEQALYRHAFKLAGAIFEPNYSAEADHFGPDLLAQIDSFFDGLSGTQNVVDDDRRMDIAFAEELTKLTFSIFHFSPIDLLCSQRFTNTKSDHDTARARADNRNLRQL